MSRMTAVDPFDPAMLDKPLWVVYGPACFPTVICCKINAVTGTPCIWGYSVYKREPGFRTLGKHLKTWIAEVDTPVYFFDDQAVMVEYLLTLITPKKGAVL